MTNTQQPTPYGPTDSFTLAAIHAAADRLAAAETAADRMHAAYDLASLADNIGHEAATDARAEGATWGEIGGWFGISRQGAQQRWG